MNDVESRREGPSDWIQWLGVEHTAQGGASVFGLRSSFGDYMDPPVTHCFEVLAPHAEALDSLRFEGEQLPDFDPEEPVARVLVNELPVHLRTTTDDSWFWFCDRCDSGPSAQVGGTLDALIENGLLDFGDGTSGTVLHIQNLEVVPSMRRMRVGSRLVRFALGLLSRSDWDVAIGELTPVRPVFQPLIPDPSTKFPRTMWADTSILRDFLARLGFREAKKAVTLPESQLKELGIASDETPVFYRKVTGWDRREFVAP